MNGVFITFEGSEGSGKSTQIEMLRQYLEAEKHEILFVREPGGVEISEKIRELLLDVKNKNMASSCELLLYMAARAQLVSEVILPALQAGKIVLCDRYLDSTVAYQGFGNGEDIQTIRLIGQYATQNLVPNLTIIFDIDAQTGLSRITGEKDRIEQRSIDYHNKVREGYQFIAQQEPERVRLIVVNKSKEEIHRDVRAFVEHVLEV